MLRKSKRCPLFFFILLFFWNQKQTIDNSSSMNQFSGHLFTLKQHKPGSEGIASRCFPEKEQKSEKALSLQICRLFYLFFFCACVCDRERDSQLSGRSVYLIQRQGRMMERTQGAKENKKRSCGQRGGDVGGGGVMMDPKQTAAFLLISVTLAGVGGK